MIRSARAVALALACAASAAVPQLAEARRGPPATPPPATGPSGPGRDLEAGRLFAQLAQATDDANALAAANASGFPGRAFDRLDGDALAAGDGGIFHATRSAFALTPARAYAELATAAARYLRRLGTHNAHVTMLAELVTQIRFNAENGRDTRADQIQRATLATLDDADDLDAKIDQQRHALCDAADGNWAAISPLARALEETLDGIEPADSPDPAPL